MKGNSGLARGTFPSKNLKTQTCYRRRLGEKRFAPFAVVRGNSSTPHSCNSISPRRTVVLRIYLQRSFLFWTTYCKTTLLRLTASPLSLHTRVTCVRQVNVGHSSHGELALERPLQMSWSVTRHAHRPSVQDISSAVSVARYRALANNQVISVAWSSHVCMIDRKCC